MTRMGMDRRWWAMGATAASLLVVGLDMTILNVALPDIAVDLNASGAQLQWFADAYLLVLSALLLPSGMLGDRFGRKRFTVAGLLVFGAGSLWCAFAATPEALIAARVVLGVGAAVLVPLAMSSVVVLFEPVERPKAIVVLGGATMIGLPLGPIVAGVLLQHYWWGSVFLINVPVIAAALGLVLAFLPESRAGVSHRARRFDGVGVVLSSTGLVGFTYGVIEGPERGWADPLVVGCLAGSVVVLTTFFLWERTLRGAEPVFDSALWRVPAFRWGTLGAAVASLAFFGVMFVVPQYLRGVLGSDALGTGLRSLPMVVTLIAGLRVTMLLLPRFGAKALGTAGFLVAAAGLALGTRVSVDSGYWLTACWTAVTGAGVGAALFASQNEALGCLPTERAASGSALIQTLRQVGSVAGIATLGALLNDTYRNHVATAVAGLPAPVADAAGQNVVSGAIVAEHVGSPELANIVHSAFVQGMSMTLWASVVVALVGAVLVWRNLPDGRALADRTQQGAPDEQCAPESDHGASTDHVLDIERR